MAVEHVTWESPELLQQNRGNLLRECRRKLRGYETRYELSSANAEKVLSTGGLQETAEVCDWIIAHHLCLSLTHER